MYVKKINKIFMSKHNLMSYSLITVLLYVLLSIYTYTTSDSGRGSNILKMSIILTGHMRLDSFLSIPLPTLTALQLCWEMKYNIRLLSNSAAFLKVCLGTHLFILIDSIHVILNINGTSCLEMCWISTFS